jgi:multisubunit Na+/H+ antiporter MnhB subunit
MPSSSRDQFSRLVRLGLLRDLRNWCVGLGVVVLALALMAVSNTVVNPETWTSAFHALAASGAFVQYAGWLAAIGVLFLLIAVLIALYLAKTER